MIKTINKRQCNLIVWSFEIPHYSYTNRCASLKKEMNWNQLKNKIYAWDGGWLDIYVHDTSSKDWEKWTQLVNQNFKIDWYNGKTEKDESKIDFSVILDYWGGNHDLCSTAKVFIGNNIQVNGHLKIVQKSC
jgi:hypothetical protein